MFEQKEIVSWIMDDNLIPFFEALAWIVDHQLSSEEKEKILKELELVDERGNTQLKHQIRGVDTVEVLVKMESGSSVYDVTVRCKKKYELEVKMALNFCMHFKVSNY